MRFKSEKLVNYNHPSLKMGIYFAANLNRNCKQLTLAGGVTFNLGYNISLFK